VRQVTPGALATWMTSVLEPLVTERRDPHDDGLHGTLAPLGAGLLGLGAILASVALLA
jgi:hypothetical protein